MIERINAFKISSGEACATLEQAKLMELALLFEKAKPADGPIPEFIAAVIMDNADAIIDILTTTATSKPRARKLHGGKKNRKASVEEVNRELQDGKQ